MRGRGFTLLEVTIAVAVLAVAIVGLASAVVTSSQSSRDAFDARMAAEDLESAIELVQGTTYAQLPTKYPDGSFLPPFRKMPLTDERIRIEYRTYDDTTGAELNLPSPPPDPLPPLLQVRLTLTWTDSTLKGGGQKRTQTARAAIVRAR